MRASPITILYGIVNIFSVDSKTRYFASANEDKRGNKYEFSRFSTT